MNIGKSHSFGLVKYPLNFKVFGHFELPDFNKGYDFKSNQSAIAPVLFLIHQFDLPLFHLILNLFPLAAAIVDISVFVQYFDIV